MILPAAVAAALAHVQLHHPDVVKVTFAQEDAQCGGFWTYQRADGSTPTFDAAIDVSLLEDALDAAWEADTFPVTYEA